MVENNMQKKINILCIIVLVIGILVAISFSGQFSKIAKDVAKETNQQLEKEIKELTGENLETYIKDSEPKHIHCDYCPGYTFNKYQLRTQEIPGVWSFTTDDTDRMVCQKCILKACIRGLDKVLGRPKYLKKRPKELRRD